MKQEPLLAAGDIRDTAALLRVRINKFAAKLRQNPGAPVLRDDAVKLAMSQGARVGDLTSAAVWVRAVVIAANRELSGSDSHALERLGGRIEELDDGDVVAALLAFVACKVRR